MKREFRCPDCHAAMERNQKRCRHCGQIVAPEHVYKKKQRGEKHEPA